MRGGKREGAGRKRKNRIQKSVMFDKKYIKYINEENDEKTFSDKLNLILKDYFDYLTYNQM